MTPLERAARAASDAVLRVIPGDIDLTPREASVIARAVIDAIREPSEGMKRAAMQQALITVPVGNFQSLAFTQEAADIFGAMIDALLAEGGK